MSRRRNDGKSSPRGRQPRNRQSRDGGGGKAYFPRHINSEEASDGITAGKYLVGNLRISGKNREEAYVTIDGLDIDIYLDGDRGRNRSLEGDLVVLAIEEKSKWKMQRSL